MCTMMTVTVKTFWRQCDPPGWYFLNLLEFIPLHSYKCFLQLWKHHKIKGIWSWKKIFDVFYNRFQEKKHPGIPPDLPWVWATWWAAASVRFKYSNLLQLQTRISIWFGIRAKKEGRLKELSRRRRVGFYSQNLAGDGFLKISKNSLLSILGGFVSCPPVL